MTTRSPGTTERADSMMRRPAPINAKSIVFRCAGGGVIRRLDGGPTTARQCSSDFQHDLAERRIPGEIIVGLRGLFQRVCAIDDRPENGFFEQRDEPSQEQTRSDLLFRRT